MWVGTAFLEWYRCFAPTAKGASLLGLCCEGIGEAKRFVDDFIPRDVWNKQYEHQEKGFAS